MRRHGQAQLENQTIWTGDNLDIMRGMNSQSVDLIYLDPPFNSKADYAAPIGSPAAGATFKDTWTLPYHHDDDMLSLCHNELWEPRMLLTEIFYMHSIGYGPTVRRNPVPYASVCASSEPGSRGG